MQGARPRPRKHPAESRVHPNGHALGVWVLLRMKRLSLKVFVDKVLESLSIVCDSLYAFGGGSLSVPDPVRDKPFVKVVPPAPTSPDTVGSISGPPRETGRVSRF